MISVFHISKKYFFTEPNEHATSMRGLLVREAIGATKMEIKNKDKIC
jgi:hypothetical protein